MKKRLPADLIEDEEERLRHDVAATKANSKTKPAKSNNSAPDALTKPAH